MKNDDEGQGLECRPSEQQHGGRRFSTQNRERAGLGPGSDRMAALEKLLCDLILTQSHREKVLLDQIANLQSELGRRSLAFQQTLAHYQRRLQQLNTRKQDEIQSVHCGDSDSGVGEEQFTLHLSVILVRQSGSLGFNVASRGTSVQKGAKDLIVSRVAPDGPAKGKLVLQDKIIKVNGVDFDGSTHDAAINFLKNAQEPIVVEVLRQLSLAWPRLAEASTQTEGAENHFSFSPNPPTRRKVEAAVEVQRNKTERVLEEDLHKYEIQYEEVTLSKLKSGAKLGLVLCYAEENESDVFVEDVDPEGVAGRDGRIQSGDQIIQVNGTDVRTRNHAIELFASDKSVVSLVVARPHLKTETDADSVVFTEGNGTCKSGPLLFSTILPLSRLEPQSILEEEEDDDEEEVFDPPLDGEKEEYDDEDDGTAGVEKDSGVGKTDGSTKNEESSSEQESVKDADKSTLGRHCSGMVSADAKPVPTTDSSVTLQTSKPNLEVTVDKSEAVELWVESTAAGSGPLQRSLDEDLCLFLPPPPPQSDLDSDALSIYSCSCKSCPRGSSSELPSGSPSTVYTDRHNLVRTIQLQQQLFRRALLATSLPSCSPPPPALEWKVKKRSDGSRCIVRRPVRNRLLKERASRLAEERRGVTTDDDAASELKVGRYWSKDERKRHLERARERHRRKEELLRSQPTADQSRSTDILELSRRKMTRLKGRALLDDFTTVQEVLAHGSRTKGGAKAPHSLLSVTTV